MLNIISKFIKNTIYFSYFLFLVIKTKGYRTKLKESKKKTIVVLANGPSLKEDIPKILKDDEYKYFDYIVLNFFAFDDSFSKIKPKQYCLADPMFFQDSQKKEDVFRLFGILNSQVHWDINLYIPADRKSQFIRYSKMTNERITVIPINVTEFYGFEKFRHYFYAKGYAVPRIQTVANLAIYVSISKNYKEIRLFGVDHTFFDSIRVNEKNQLCSNDAHFYENSRSVLKPMYRYDKNEIWKVGDYINALSYMFKSHDLLEKYAATRNIKIINYTKISMIDSYQRKEL